MNIAKYIEETRGEFRHVKWPTRREATVSTLLVVGISVAVSLFLFVFDVAFVKLLGLLLINQ